MSNISDAQLPEKIRPIELDFEAGRALEIYLLDLRYEEERKQTIRRIISGIKQAQRDGKWTSRPPKGFTTDENGYLVPDIEEFFQVQAAIERVLNGESIYSVAKTTPISRRTLTRILDDTERLRLYVDAEPSDERLADALAGTEIDGVDLPTGFEERIRSVVREELSDE